MAELLSGFPFYILFLSTFFGMAVGLFLTVRALKLI
ncbi:cytochrome b6-f complex subunit PetL [Prochlorothrix hollandica]